MSSLKKISIFFYWEPLQNTYCSWFCYYLYIPKNDFKQIESNPISNCNCHFTFKKQSLSLQQFCNNWTILPLRADCTEWSFVIINEVSTLFICIGLIQYFIIHNSQCTTVYCNRIKWNASLLNFQQKHFFKFLMSECEGH